MYFGYPVAHEDDARRAVRSGLEIVEESAAGVYPSRYRCGSAFIRAVVVGEIGAGERTDG